MFKLLTKAKRYLLSMVFIVVLLFVIALCNLMLPRLMASLINDGINGYNNSYILRIGILMLGVSLFVVLCQMVTNYLTAMVSMGFGRDLRSEVFKKITYFSLQQSDEFGTASLVNRTAGDVREMQQLLQMGLNSIVSVPLNMIGGIIMAIIMDLRLALIIICTMPILLILIYININWVRPIFEIMRDRIDVVNRILRENLAGVRVIRAFNTIKKEQNRFNDANIEYTNANRKARHRMALLNPLTTVVINLAIVTVYWFGQFRIRSGSMSAGDIMAFAQYVTQILGAVMGMQMVFNMIPGALTAASRLNNLLDSDTLVSDSTDPIVPPEGVVGVVQFEGVTFGYPGAEKPVLEDISFKTAPGEVTAIIGGTGSGKSTVASLIPRLYDIQSGTIYVNETDITKMLQFDLRSRIGFVTQQAQLFTGSIAQNISFGKDSATLQEIREAASIAQVDDFIMSLDEGYDSFVSQDATNLSGGQKQRISIARTIIRRPEIYIFDDSFSALDFKTDSALRLALKKITTNSTVIIVAQRVSTIMDADRIIVLDEGKCVGQGTHKQLMQTCDVYREIVHSQLREDELDEQQ